MIQQDEFNIKQLNSIRDKLDHIGIDQLQQFANELESKLASAENSILEHRQNEMRLQKEIQQLKRRNDSEEIEDLKHQLAKMEEGAIAIIMEKEKMIQELKEQQSIILSNLPVFEQPQQQNQENEKELELRAVVSELQFKLENDQLKWEERMIQLEHEVTQRLLEGMSQQLNESKNVEYDLLHQVHLSEEKLKHYDKMVQDQDRLIAQLKDEHSRESTQHETRLQELQLRLQTMSNSLNRSESKMDDHQTTIAQLTRERNDLNKARDDQLKTNIRQEHQLRTLNTELEEYRQTLETAQQTIDELQTQINQLELRCHELQTTQFHTSSHPHPDELMRIPTDNDDQQQGQGGNLLSELLIEAPKVPESPRADIKLFSSPKRTSSMKKSRHDDYEHLKDENNNLKRQMELLEIDNENYENTIELLQKEIKNAFLELQQLRKSKISTTSEVKEEVSELRTHLQKLETYVLQTKLRSAEDINFLIEEKKIAERDAIESQMLYRQALTEKEYFQAEYRKLEKKIQQKKEKKKLSPVKEEQQQTPPKKGFFGLFK